MATISILCWLYLQIKIQANVMLKQSEKQETFFSKLQTIEVDRHTCHFQKFSKKTTTLQKDWIRISFFESAVCQCMVD